MSTEHKILARIPISVRWRDMDSMGHVNNAKYISYLEEARVRWMLGVDGVSMTDRIAPVVAATNVNYRLPIVWPNDILVELFVERLGNSSVTIGHRIVAEDGTLHCDGHAVTVWIDRRTGKSRPLPDGVRRVSELLLQICPIGKPGTKTAVNLFKCLFTIGRCMVRIGVNPMLKLVDYRYPRQCF